MKCVSSLFLCAVVAACGSSSSENGPSQVSLVLTDAANEELSQFEVDVDSVVFRKPGGVEVSVLSRSARVDFVALESLSELVAVRSLEAGAYNRVTMTLDFSDANVVIAGATSPATVVDGNGAPITGPVDVVVNFPGSAAPGIGVARRHLFVLDLDLSQSVVVDEPNNRVTFTPVLHAQVDPEQPKPVTTTGFLGSVELTRGTFVVSRRTPSGDVVGEYTVRTTPATVFQIDGEVALGEAGLALLVNRTEERVFVQGTFDPGTGHVDALAVEAGAGVPGNGQDWVLGHVVARSGGAGADATLTVLGHAFDATTSARTWNTQYTANLSFAETNVLRRGAEPDLDADAINVGQLVWLFGDLDAGTIDLTGTGSTGKGVARLLRTSIHGIATEAPAFDTLTLDVTRFGLREVSLFDFTVAGQEEANPDAFTVDVTGLSTQGIGNGSRLRVFGWVNGVAVSGDENATAVSIVDRGATARVLLCQWNPPDVGGIPAAQPSATGFVFDVADAGIRVVGDGFTPLTINTSPLPELRALAGFGFYSIASPNGLELYTNFATFREAVIERAGEPVFRVTAFGGFDPSTQVFSALTACVVFDD